MTMSGWMWVLIVYLALGVFQAAFFDAMTLRTAHRAGRTDYRGIKRIRAWVGLVFAWPIVLMQIMGDAVGERVDESEFVKRDKGK
jgi:hypothetical protein